MTPLQALAELVALKDLKSRMERSLAASMARGNNPSEQYHAWKDDYNRRKPLAWAAARAVLAQGEGWVMVPKEPTPEMVEAGVTSRLYATHTANAEACYLAMIAAATKDPT